MVLIAAVVDRTLGNSTRFSGGKFLRLFAQAGKARTRTGPKVGLPAWNPTIGEGRLSTFCVSVGVGVGGNRVFFMGFEETCEVCSKGDSCVRSSLNPRLIRTTAFLDISSLNSSSRALTLVDIFSNFLSFGKHFFRHTYCEPWFVVCNSPFKILPIVPRKSHYERPKTAIRSVVSIKAAQTKHCIELEWDTTAFFGVEVRNMLMILLATIF